MKGDEQKEGQREDRGNDEERVKVGKGSLEGSILSFYTKLINVLGKPINRDRRLP